MTIDVVPARTDPMRNFKFQVDLNHPQFRSQIAQAGFTNVAGINMTTEVIPYREGGWNTNMHKLPGQTDFGPLTLVQGVMYTNPAMWLMAKQMFAVQWGAGTLGPDNRGSFRFDATVRVLDHPVTMGAAAGAPAASQPHDGARLAFVFYGCWVGSVAFNDLDAAGNAVLISQMTMHHEGFEVLYADEAILAAAA